MLTFELCGRAGFGVDGEQGKVSRDLLEASFLVDAVDSTSHSQQELVDGVPVSV